MYRSLALVMTFGALGLWGAYFAGLCVEYVKFMGH
jgi:hypothetical protein